MIIKFKYCLFGLSLFSFIPSSYSTILPAEIKGTYHIFYPEYRHLSILPGMIWAKSGVTENLSDLYVGNNANIILIRELFHRHPQEGFILAQSSTNPAKNFTPFIMGSIAAFLNDVKIAFDKETNQRKKIDIKNIAVKKLGILIKEMTQKAGKSYPNLFVNALFDSDENISVFKVIGAFTYMKSPNKQALHEYYLGIVKNKASEVAITDIFSDTTFVDNQAQWVFDKFQEIDIAPYDFEASYEQMAFTLLSLISGSWIEPYLTQFFTAYVSSAGQKFGFPDCGENSLLNLYRILFAKKETASIDIDLLRTINTPEKLINFFLTKIKTADGVLDFSRLEDLRSQEARDAWAQLTSNLDNLCKIGGSYVNRETYCKMVRPESLDCEINFGFKNLNNFIQELQGKNFDQLITAINIYSDNNFMVEKNLDDKGFGTININTKDRGKFTWGFSSQHFYLNAESTLKFFDHWLPTLIKEKSPKSDLLALLPINSAKSSILSKGIDNHYQILLNRLDSDDAIANFFGDIIQFDLEKLLRVDALLKRIQNDDTHVRVRNIIFNKGSEDDIKTYVGIIKSLNKSSILWVHDHKSALTLILAREPFNKTLFDYVLKSEKVEELVRPTTKSNILNNIIMRGDYELFTRILPNLTQENFEWKDKYGLNSPLHLALQLRTVSTNDSKNILETILQRISDDSIDGKALQLALPIEEPEIFKNLLRRIKMEPDSNSVLQIISDLLEKPNTEELMSLLLDKFEMENLLTEYGSELLDAFKQAHHPSVKKIEDKLKAISKITPDI